MDLEETLSSIQVVVPSYEYVDYYREARDSYLSSRFPSYPKLEEVTLEVSFRINRSKNAPVVYAILDALPAECVNVDVNEVVVSLPNEGRIVECFNHVVNLLAVVRNWKSLVISSSNQKLDWLGMRYLLSYVCDKNDICEPEFSYITIEGLRRAYLSGGKTVRRTTVKKEEELPPLVLTGTRETLAQEVSKRYEEIYLSGFEVKRIATHPYEVVLLVEDSLIVDFCIIYSIPDRSWYEVRQVEDYDATDDDHYRCLVQELTPNSLFKFNYAAFRRSFAGPHPAIDFLKFAGLNNRYYSMDRTRRVIARYPELHLQERLDAYPGVTYHFIVLEMEASDGTLARGIGYTKGKVQTYILKICKDLEEMNSRSLELNGTRTDSMPYSLNKEFVAAFLSWKGKKKRWRLENKFAYYYLDKSIRQDAEVYSIPSEVLLAAERGMFDDVERGTYSKPLNRWKSEELVFKTTKRLYGDYQVIYQFSPHFLSTGSGTLSYDVYICGLKVAIEYQGLQHFQPVDFFGGAENHEKQVERDRLKMELSKANGVRLVYVNYWEDVTPQLIREKVEAALSKSIEEIEFRPFRQDT